MRSQWAPKLLRAIRPFGLFKMVSKGISSYKLTGSSLQAIIKNGCFMFSMENSQEVWR